MIVLNKTVVAFQWEALFSLSWIIIQLSILEITQWFYVAVFWVLYIIPQLLKQLLKSNIFVTAAFFGVGTLNSALILTQTSGTENPVKHQTAYKRCTSIEQTKIQFRKLIIIVVLSIMNVWIGVQLLPIDVAEGNVGQNWRSRQKLFLRKIVGRNCFPKSCYILS